MEHEMFSLQGSVYYVYCSFPLQVSYGIISTEPRVFFPGACGFDLLLSAKLLHEVQTAWFDQRGSWRGWSKNM